MKTLEDESVHLVLTSPPYPMIEMWDEIFSLWNKDIATALNKQDGNSAFSAMHASLDAVWDECARVLIPGGFACINIGDATRTVGDRFRLYSNHARIIQAFTKRDFDCLPVILWRKQTNSPTKFMGSGMYPSGAYVTLEHEYILVFRKGAKRVFSASEQELRRNSAFFWEERNIWFSDVWDFKGIKQAISSSVTRDRSAAYPLELVHRLLNMYSVAGDTVVDPFLGTGTTLLGCLLNARVCIGYEIDSGLESLIRENVESFAPEVTEIVRRRYENHLGFINAYTQRKGEPKYTNENYKCRVITKQETKLQLYSLSDIQYPQDNVISHCHTVFHP